MAATAACVNQALRDKAQKYHISDRTLESYPLLIVNCLWNAGNEELVPFSNLTVLEGLCLLEQQNISRESLSFQVEPPGYSETILQVWDYLHHGDWEKKVVFLPESQQQVRNSVNNTACNIAPCCLHQGLFVWAERDGSRTALIDHSLERPIRISYSELANKIKERAAFLQQMGIHKGNYVAVSLPRGMEQIINVYAVLCAGAAYIPVGIHHPLERKKSIYLSAPVKAVLTDETGEAELQGWNDVMILNHAACDKVTPLPVPIYPEPEQVAYVIFTSGSTGKPKGVMITHKAAWNTISDINNRFAIAAENRAIQLSELDFDLSVYDLFGILSAGGTLLLLGEEQKKEPRVWDKLVREHRVTMWNSVPALYEMLLAVNSDTESLLPLKKVLLSGDWVKPELFSITRQHTKDCRFIALGGATEASIWSNYFEVENLSNEWRSIPYGIPLANQLFRIVNAHEMDCPDAVAGELWIGGAGVAEGYLNQPELTADRFVELNGVRWYKTGDLARYWADGTVEFLGRMDTQVKVNGFRIELSEIESVLKESQGVEQAIACVSPCGNQLLAAVIPAGICGKCVVTHEESNEHMEDNELVQRGEFVEQLLLRICGFDHLTEPLQVEFQNYNPAYHLWLDWLCARQVLIADNGIAPGPRYVSVMRKTNPEQALYKVMLRHIALMRDVLTGTKEPGVLLAVPELNPEYLVFQSFQIQLFISQVVDRLQQENNGEKKYAVLTARSGLAAEKLISQIPNASWTLFDPSSGMLAIAKERLEKAGLIADYTLQREGAIAEEEFRSFDAVIAVNTLHTWANPAAALRQAECLLKNTGKFYAVEFAGLDPMGLCISALLENGFAAKDGVVRRPFFTENEWSEYFTASSFQQANIKRVLNSPSMTMEAIPFSDRIDSDIQMLRQKLKTRLPEYMLPMNYTIIPYLQLTENGKVDRNWINELCQSCSTHPAEELKGTQAFIGEIWKELIGCTPRSSLNFFEAGGDSILATKFLVALKERSGVQLLLKDMVMQPTIEELAKLVDEKQAVRGEIVEGEL